MNDLSIFPADIAEMSVSQLANLPAQQLVEVDTVNGKRKLTHILPASAMEY